MEENRFIFKIMMPKLTYRTIESKFESGGVNQTVHHIYLVVETEIITISPEYSEKVNYKTDYEIAQTVIVGSTPSTYADIVR